ncbi:MAG TPA: hypothetical protein VNZ05_03695 [Solirubrobacteraceae bacterium]|nr:hypothetical protein [Solirubrobacteraceae bacterium]
MAHAKREVLLRAYRHLLLPEDLEDCYSQATLELLARARHGASFADVAHVANTLELRFASRIRDVRRARAGRSPMQSALAGAVSINGSDGHELAIIDHRYDLEQLVLVRSDLRRVQSSARALSADQRLAIACQLDGSGPLLCRHLGWSAEKYRKVAQRGRARLRTLMSD